MTDVVAALIWDHNRFLACQRPAHKARGLLWEFVGGKVELGETHEDALVRECMEELGITVGVGEKFMEVIHDYPDLTVRLSLYNAVIIDGIPQKLEHNDIRWITTAQIPEFSFCPADEDILQRLISIDNQTQAKLYSLRDEAYKSFQCSLMPSVDKNRVLGVRVPILRKLSKELSLDDLSPLPHRYFEEDMLHVLMIARETDPDKTIHLLDEFLPYVDNWSVCDSAKIKAFQNCPPQLMEAILKWIQSDHTYTVRFAIGILMKCYLKNHFEPEHFKIVANILSDDYYINMMIAWYFATALYFQPEAAITVLENRILPRWVHQKTIQKACESLRISADMKTYLRTLKY